MAKRAATAEEEVTVETTTGSVYEALGYPNHEEMVRKATLVSAISDAIEARGLTQARVSEIAGIDQPTLSKLLRGRFKSISTDRLTDILNALGSHTMLVVMSGAAGEGAVRGHSNVVLAEAGRRLVLVDGRVESPAELVGSGTGIVTGAVVGA